MSCEIVRNSTTPCETTVDSPTGRNVMRDSQKFNNILRDDGRLTNWTECHARWSEIQQHLARRRSTHSLNGMSCEMVRNSTTPCKTTVDSPTGRNVMRDGQKFNNTLQDDGRLTNWTECHAKWSEIQQHLARRRSTHRLDGMSYEMVRNSTTLNTLRDDGRLTRWTECRVRWSGIQQPCETTVDSPPGRNVMRDGQKFNNTLQNDGRLTSWTEFRTVLFITQCHLSSSNTHRLENTLY